MCNCSAQLYVTKVMASQYVGNLKTLVKLLNIVLPPWPAIAKYLTQSLIMLWPIAYAEVSLVHHAALGTKDMDDGGKNISLEVVKNV